MPRRKPIQVTQRILKQPMSYYLICINQIQTILGKQQLERIGLVILNHKK